MREILVQLQNKYNKLGLSRTEMAKELGISTATFDRMLANGDDLPKYRRVSKQYFFPLKEVADFLSQTEDRAERDNNHKRPNDRSTK